MRDERGCVFNCDCSSAISIDALDMGVGNDGAISGTEVIVLATVPEEDSPPTRLDDDGRLGCPNGNEGAVNAQEVLASVRNHDA